MHTTRETSTLRRSIPLARPNITQAEIDAVTAVLRTPYLSLGPKIGEFESAFAKYCDCRYAIACSSGTTGLHLLIRAVGIQPDDQVITTPFSFIASTNCILQEGGVPVFVDIDPNTWNIDAGKTEEALTPKTKAILPVDVFGQVADFDTISKIAKRNELAVIEDSCEALGGRRDGRAAGTFGDAGVFGFYPNKQITTGEGGMIVTNDDRIAQLCRSMRNQGRDVQDGWLSHARFGFNYRLSDIHCALGIAQLRRIDEILAERKRVAESYRARLTHEPRLVMQTIDPGVDMSWFVFVVRLADGYAQNDRDRILTELKARGIGCSNYFWPIHLQPAYTARFGAQLGRFPVCEAVAARTIALPFHHELTEEDIEWICDELCGLL